MNEQSTGVRAFRVFVFALVSIYFLLNFVPGGTSDQFGWNWRFLTIWGQTLSFLVAGFMLARSFGWTRVWPDMLVSVTVVMNLIVVFLYWQLYFSDPALVSDGDGIVWWREYYVHLMGPVFQWIDAFLIFGCFRLMVRIVPATLGLMLAYIAWIELALRPLSSSPAGTVTSGLPYPFLNDMVLSERGMFYLTTIITALVFITISWAVSALLRRFAGLGTARHA